MNTMFTIAKKTLKKLICGAVVIAASAASQAQELRYITDIHYVPMRSGAGNEYRIITTRLKSGNKLVLLEGKNGDDWLKVRTEGGTEGWIRSQYISFGTKKSKRAGKTEYGT